MARVKYQYVTSSGADYTIVVEDYHQEFTAAQLGLATASTDPILPRNIKPARALIESPTGRRKNIYCGDGGTLVSQTPPSITGVEIDDETGWVVTGRVGERQSFTSVPNGTFAT